MKFKLFQRLRSGGDGSETSAQSTAQAGLGEPEMDDSALSGGDLERTVENMFQQGYSEDEIKQELQGQYSEADIQNAVNQTVTDNATSNQGPDIGGMPQQGDQGMVDQEMQSQGMQNMQPPGGNQAQQQPVQQDQQVEPIQSPNGEQQDQGPVDQRVEELIETIVAENFQRVTEEFQNMYEELDLIEEELEDLDQRVHDLEVRDDEDQQEFVQKVDEMEDHIDSYQSRIGGLEKAFQQVLPNLVDNVRDLTSLVQEMKQQEGIETNTDVSEQDVEEVNEELQDW
jgi:hypothetical protein